MVAKRQKEKKIIYQEEASAGKAGRFVAAVVLYGTMLLLGYIVIASPQSGTAMGSIQSVLYGLGGRLAILIPLLFGWAATLTVVTSGQKKISPRIIVGDAAMFLLLFTAVQLFVTGDILRNHMAIRVYANYLVQSFRYEGGGGAIGGLLAWPLYSLLGQWGGLILAVLAALLILTAEGRLQKWTGALEQGAVKVRKAAQQQRMIHKNEQMFDIETVQAPKRRAPESTFEDMELLGGTAPAGRTRRTEGRRNSRFTMAAGGDPDQFPLSREQKRGRIEPDRPSALKRKKKPVVESWENFIPEEAAVPADDPVPVAAVQEIPPVVQDVPGTEEIPKPSKAKKKAPAAGVSPAAQSDDIPAVNGELSPAQKRPGSREPSDDLNIEPDRCDVLADAEEEIPAQKKRPMQKLKRVVSAEPEEEPYNYPPIDLLQEGENVKENFRDADMKKAEMLEETLKQFGISSRLTGIAHGPTVTRFELQPAPGVKVSRITALADDIAMHLAAMSVRIEAPIPGKAAVGVEIPNDKVETVRLRDVLESPEARKSSSRIAIGLGKDNSGRYMMADIAKMPHVLIAGQTGSGKSVCINSIITSILFRASPEEVRLILIDPKVVELSIYNDIPHLVCPVVTDCKKAASALEWAVSEMTMRYKRFAERGVRNIKGYNEVLQAGEKPMPQMVIVIDELADLMMVAPGEVEDSICRLAQLARAAGMHLVIATQRPSVNVITGIIKANIPTRIAFSVASQVDSRTMIDHGGAEKLLGNGDMLFVPSGTKPIRVQGSWVSDDEVHAIVSYIKERSETSYDADMIEQMDNAVRSDAEKEEVAADYDPRLPEAVEIVVEAGQASVSMLQRRMRVGYAHAGRIIDEMEQRGIISPGEGAKPRSVLISREEMASMFEDDEPE